MSGAGWLGCARGISRRREIFGAVIGECEHHPRSLSVPVIGIGEGQQQAREVLHIRRLAHDGNNTSELDKQIVGRSRSDEALEAQWGDEGGRAFARTWLADGACDFVLWIILTDVCEDGCNEGSPWEVGACPAPIKLQLLE